MTIYAIIDGIQHFAFDKIDQQYAFLWNTMIQVHASFGHYEETFAMIYKVQKGGHTTR
jgi:hypothetical protein